MNVKVVVMVMSCFALSVLVNLARTDQSTGQYSVTHQGLHLPQRHDAPGVRGRRAEGHGEARGG